MKLVLPLPPSDNEAYRSVVGYRKQALIKAVAADDRKGILSALFVNVTKSKAYRDYEKACEVPLAAQVTDCHEGPVQVEVYVHFANNRRDLLNVQKVLLDVIEGWVYKNDRQIEDFHIRKGFNDPDTPRVEVEVTPMAPELFTAEELEATKDLDF